MDTQEKNKTYTVIGMMSGTSLDGVDLSLATYYKNGKKWKYNMLCCKTYPYENQHINLLKSLSNTNCSYLSFRKKQIEYSAIIAKFIQNFIDENRQISTSIDFISLHGHTIFHQPSQSITVQAVNLQYLAAKLKKNIIGNFRQLDVFNGGQGAPLAPFGEQLFDQGIYLNLGGIANIGYKGKGYDLVFCNMILNKFSQKISQKPYDDEGKLAQKGKIIQQDLQMLRSKFANPLHQSLARESAQQYLSQITNSSQSSQILINKMRTFYQFISQTIIDQIHKFYICQKIDHKEYPVICTGGGAYNSFLISLFNKNQYGLQFILPDKSLIEFKQSLIFGLLGVKFMENEWNCASGIGGQLAKGQITGNQTRSKKEN